MRRREFIGFGSGLVGALFVSGCSAMNQGGSAAPAGAPKTFKLGVYAPLTGETAENGQNFKRSFELYADQVNAAGGINGEKIELVIRDDKGEPKTAASIAQEFAQDESIDATLGSFSSTASMAAAPVLVKAGIPNISPTSSHPDYTSLGKGLFRGTNTQKVEAKQVAEFLGKTQGKKKIAIVHRQDDWGISAANNFEEGAKGLGVQITGKQAVAPESKDFRTVITSLRGGDPEAVYVALQYSDATVFAQQMAAAGWKPTVATSTALYTQKLIELGGAGVEGWYVASFFFSGSSKPVVAEYVKAYTDKYGKAPDAFAAVAYDSIKVLGEAKKQVPEDGAAGRTKLRDAISKTTVDGVTGSMKFDDKGDVEKSMTWLVVKDGKFTQA
ncbi:ABC transporter substrate-binding protein [Naumannella sp. ID2617S]|nr:ABC transporter substrate-binding protein [Naumannella sp. ID2617S]